MHKYPARTASLRVCWSSCLPYLPHQLHNTEQSVSIAQPPWEDQGMGKTQTAWESGFTLRPGPVKAGSLHTHSCSSSAVPPAPSSRSWDCPPQKASGSSPSPISTSHSHLSGKMPVLSAGPRDAHEDIGTKGKEPGRPRARDPWMSGGSQRSGGGLGLDRAWRHLWS